MNENDPDPVAVQSGWGFAAYLIVLALLKEIMESGVLPYDRINEALEHALLTAETSQMNALVPSPEMVRVARMAIDFARLAAKVKDQRRNTPPNEQKS